MTADALQSLLDEGSSFEGKVAFSGVVRIDGHFRGEAQSDGTLVVGEKGDVQADVEVDALVVHGRFRGRAHARREVQIAASAEVEGSVITRSLVVEDGAVLNATVEMNGPR